MNGVHDMGGMQCHGPVRPEANEPLFHAPWEREAMALTVAMGASGQWNIDQMRSARESLPPAQYLSLSYYQIWIQALCDMMLARGLVEPHVSLIDLADSMRPPTGVLLPGANRSLYREQYRHYVESLPH